MMIKYSAQLFFLFFLSVTLFPQNFDISLKKQININETNFKINYIELNASLVTSLSVAIPAGIALADFIKHDKQLQIDALYMSGAFIFPT